MTENKMTLKKLLDKYIVKIPPIQRDYAFGRDNEEIKINSKNFISYLINGIKENKKIHLDFIYGKIDDGIFTPLDGQQRITTLWLLFLYMYKRNYDGVSEIKFSRFTYDTRISTRDFCEEIINIKFNFEKKVLISLEDKWYFSLWNNDPSISSMINILNIIHEIFWDIDKIEYHDNISFSFLNVETLGNPEDLYVKMNSRGKQLSEWDLFKSSLFEVIDEKDKLWIDTELLDFYFSRVKNKEMVEESLHNLFNLVIMIKELLNPDKKIKLDYSDVEKVRKFINVITNDNFLSKIKENGFKRFNDKGLRFKELIEIIIKPKSEHKNYGDLDLFFPYFKYLTNQNNIENIDFKELEQVIRIATNFEETYRKEYAAVISFVKTMDKALDWEKGIIDFLVSYSGDINFGNHSQEQLEEEKIKAQIIKSNNEDDINSIYEAEKNEAFNGMIGFLLKSIDYENFNKKEFDKNYEFIKGKFNKEGIKKHVEMFDILKYKDVTERKGIFPQNRDQKGSKGNIFRDYSWRRFFRNLGFKKNDKSLDKWIVNWREDKQNIKKEWINWIVEFKEYFSDISGIKENISEKSEFKYFYIIVNKNIGFNATKYTVPLYILSKKLKDNKIENQYDGFTNIDNMSNRDHIIIVNYGSEESRVEIKYNLSSDMFEYDNNKLSEKITKIIKELEVEFRRIKQLV